MNNGINFGIKAMTVAGKFITGNRGSAGAEFSLVLPLLLTVVFGSIEVGRLLHDFHVIDKSVRDGTRFLSRVPVTCNGAGAGSFTNAADLTTAKNLTLTGTVDTPSVPGDYLLGYWNDASTITYQVQCITNASYEGAFFGYPFIPAISGSAVVPFSFLFGSMVTSTSSITITANHKSLGYGE